MQDFVILLIASTVQGFLGFGFGILATVGLTLASGLVHATGVVNIAGVYIVAANLHALRRHVDWITVKRMIPAMLIGVGLGVFALASLDTRLMVRVLGGYIVLVAIWNFRARTLAPRESVAADSVVGLLSGVLSGAFNAGGPPLIDHLYRRPVAPVVIKGTIQALFLTMSLARIPVALTQGLLDGAAGWTALIGIPFVLGGLYAGLALGKRVPARHFRRMSWVGLGVLGAVLLAR